MIAYTDFFFEKIDRDVIFTKLKKLPNSPFTISENFSIFVETNN